MSRHISKVLDINPGTKKSWTVLVQVIEDGHEQVSQSGRRYRRLVLSDSEGTKFNAVIYESHLRFLACLLLQYRRYYISNALVYENDARYHISEYQYYWVINNRTLVEELVESIPTTLACQFEFTGFNDLYKYADAEYPLNVKAIVLHCFPSREAGLENKTRRDIVIVNEEKKLLLLTLWDQFDQKDGNTLADLIGTGPVIFGMRLRVTTFNSLSLTTKASSCLLINPPEDESNKLKDWYNENKQELQELLQLKSYKNTDLLLPYPKEEDIITIAKAASLLNTPAWVKGKASFPTQQRTLWYTACANCQKGLEADLSWVVTCPSCKVESNVQAISRLTIVIDDGTKNIRATICTPDAEKLMPFTAIQLKEADELGLDYHKEISESVQQQTVVAYIRSYKATFQGHPQVNTSVVKCYKAQEALSLPNISSQQGEQPSKSTTNTGSQETIDREQPSKSSTNTGSQQTIDKPKSQVSIPKTPLKQAKRSVPVPASTTLPLHINKEASVSAQETDGSATKKMKETSK